MIDRREHRSNTSRNVPRGIRSMVVSEFRAALDLDHRYCSLCAERAKPGRGKPVLIMRIGFFACFHAISLETQSFQQNHHVIFHVLIALAYLDRV